MSLTPDRSISKTWNYHTRSSVNFMCKKSVTTLQGQPNISEHIMLVTWVSQTYQSTHHACYPSFPNISEHTSCLLPEFPNHIRAHIMLVTRVSHILCWWIEFVISCLITASFNHVCDGLFNWCRYQVCEVVQVFMKYWDQVFSG